MLQDISPHQEVEIELKVKDVNGKDVVNIDKTRSTFLTSTSSSQNYTASVSPTNSHVLRMK